MSRWKVARYLILMAMAGCLAGCLFVLSRLPRGQEPFPQGNLFQDERKVIRQGWKATRLLILGPMAGQLHPIYRFGDYPSGGVAVAGRHLADARSRSPTFTLCLGLGPFESANYPRGAHEEVARRKQVMWNHLTQAGLNLLVEEDAEGRRFLLRREDVWEPQGGQLVVDFSGVALGFTLEGPRVDSEDAPHPPTGADLNFFILRSGSGTRATPRGFDVLLAPLPAATFRRQSPHQYPFPPGGRAGRFLETLVPRADRAGEVHSFSELRRTLDLLERASHEAQSKAGKRATESIQWMLREGQKQLSAQHHQVFLRTHTQPFVQDTNRPGPGEALLDLHSQADRKQYPEISSQAFRSSDHPGSDTCRACHQSEADFWQGTRHAEAYVSLRDRDSQRSPACVGCHTTGFDPSGKIGWSRMEQLGASEGVGCTACHLPTGSRKEHPWGKASGCSRCHTSLTDPDFDRENDSARISCDAVTRR